MFNIFGSFSQYFPNKPICQKCLADLEASGATYRNWNYQLEFGGAAQNLFEESKLQEFAPIALAPRADTNQTKLQKSITLLLRQL